MTRQTLQLSVRLLVLLLALALVLLFVTRPAEADAPVNSVEYVVQSGDTLWEIATATGDGADPRETILIIQDLNGLTGGDIFPGQVLSIPSA